MEHHSRIRLCPEAPVGLRQPVPGTWLVDFGRVAFGNLLLTVPPGSTATITVHFGDASRDGRIDRTPPGAVRYASVPVPLQGIHGRVVVAPAPDRQNTGPQAIALPAAWGVILPFRWIEIEGWPDAVPFTADLLTRQASYAATWDDRAAAFACSDSLLNQIWELCRHSIKATTFAGLFVDGDRERIPYEADAYLNQLSYYACQPDPAFARATFDHLLRAPTWPTEWDAHMVFMAHADWMHTGDRAWLAGRYESLKQKLLPGRERADGLIASTAAHIKRGDLIDWPPHERDGFVFTAANTVVNAFQYRALLLMAEMAEGVGKSAEGASFRERAATLAGAFHAVFFDAARGVFRDGEGTDSASQHANLFPLAFGLVPAAHRESVCAHLKSKGMACSVYAAQYLMEALFQAGEAEYALALMTAPGNRSWRGMVESGTTITWEIWDPAGLPKDMDWARPDWTHAWGAAPVNLLSRFALGVRPLNPGGSRVALRPQLGNLSWARGTVPTMHGPIQVSARKNDAGGVDVEFSAPPGVEIVR